MLLFISFNVWYFTICGIITISFNAPFFIFVDSILSIALLNGKLGSLAEPSNIDSWVNLINKNLSYSYKERFEIISERIKILEKELSWKVLFDKTKELYDEIIKNDR